MLISIVCYPIVSIGFIEVSAYVDFSSSEEEEKAVAPKRRRLGGESESESDVRLYSIVSCYFLNFYFVSITHQILTMVKKEEPRQLLSVAYQLVDQDLDVLLINGKIRNQKKNLIFQRRVT